MNLWRIILFGILFICTFSHCSKWEYATYDWYESLTGYQDALQLARKNASIFGNSFVYGDIHYYSIWSYYSINGKTYIIVYKFHKKNLVFYRICQYSGNLKWLKQFDERNVSSAIFWNFPAGDDFPLVFNLKTNIKITTYDFGLDFDSFLNDPIENDFLKNLRNDMIKYNLTKFSKTM